MKTMNPQNIGGHLLFLPHAIITIQSLLGR